jgi:NADPH:quinone reductase-like Zn-dependent oxidoreductase
VTVTAMRNLAAGTVHPVADQAFPMAAAAEAHRRMEADAHFGKLVLNWREPAG